MIEQRPLVEGTIRWAFPPSILVSSRNRVEFRIINGVYSWRYRNQVKVERQLRLSDRFTTSPYLSMEAYYDSRVDVWNRFRFSAGTEQPLGKHWSLEPYYTRQITTHTAIRNTNAVGMTLHLYLP